MEKFLSLFMYVLWVAAIIAILATTLTGFQYFDLNVLAGVLLGFAVINSMFVVMQKK